MNELRPVITNAILDVVSTMSKDDVDFWAENTDLLKKKISKSLVRFNKIQVKQVGTVRIQRNSIFNYLEFLKNGFCLSPVVEGLLSNKNINVDFNEIYTKYDLFIANTYEITGKNSANTVEIFTSILFNGYDLCPIKTIIEFRLGYTKQPFNEFLRVVMSPLLGEINRRYILVVGHDRNGPWLEIDNYDEGYKWSGNHNWLFCKKIYN